MNSVLEQVKNNDPSITYSTFYGAVEIAPYNLAIWYFFKTDNDLSKAQGNGLADNIKKLTINEMINNGYPPYTFENTTEINKDFIYFSSEEDVKNTTGGNYYYYFK